MAPARRFLAAALLALCLQAAAVAALYEKDGPVSLLTTRSFSKVLDSELPVVVEFFAPWCGHCKSLAPAFTKAAEKLKHIVPFVAVDCDAEKNRPLCGQYGVQGFPTIKLFKPGKAAPTDYLGERSAKALVEAATGMLSAKHVKRVASDADAAAALEGAGPKVLLFTDKSHTSPLFKSLATRFHSKLGFLEVGAKATETAERFGVTARPTLLTLGADGQAEAYKGELKATSLVDHLKKFAAAAAAGGKVGSGGKAEKAQAKPEAKQDASKEEGGSGGAGEGDGESKQQEQQQGEQGTAAATLPDIVKNATLAELEKDLLPKEGSQLLAFYAGSDAACAEKLQQLNAAVHGLAGLAPAAQVHLASPEDIDKAAKEYSQLDKDALAAAGEETCSLQLFLLPYKDKDETEEWKKLEGEPSAKELHKAALGIFPASHVTPITSETQKTWILQDPSRIKVLLFSDKEEAPPLYRALSCNFLDYRMDFGLASSSNEPIMKQFGVTKVPHLLIAIARPENADEMGMPKGPEETAKAMPIATQPYTGPMSYRHIAMFLKFAALQLGAAPEGVLEEVLGPQGAAAAKAPRSAAVVPQLKSQDDFERVCLDKGGICIIAALPPEPEQPAAQASEEGGAEAQEGAARAGPSLELAVLQRLAAQHSSSGALHFGWVDATRHKGFLAALGASGPNQVVALSPRKSRNAVMGGPIKLDTVDAFLDGLLSGRMTTAPLQNIPDLVEDKEEEAEEAPVEEEFDLADIMGEEVEGELEGHRKERVDKEAEEQAQQAAAAKKMGKKKKGGKKKKKSSASKDEL